MVYHDLVVVGVEEERQLQSKYSEHHLCCKVAEACM